MRAVRQRILGRFPFFLGQFGILKLVCDVGIESGQGSWERDGCV